MIKSRVWAHLLLTVTHLLPVTVARASELSPPEIYDRVVASTLAVKVTTRTGERYIGAAFLAFKPDLAVTAWHLVCDAAEIRGTFSDGTPAEIEGIIAKDERHDLAILRVAPTDRAPLAINIQTPRVASRLYAIGSPRGYTFSISDGLLSQVQMIDGYPQYQLTCPFSPGNSGGPVVNTAGEVVGVCAWSKVGAQNLNFAIPSQFALSLAAGFSPDVENATANNTSEPNAEPVSAASSGTTPMTRLSFEGFQKFLRSLAGREVRITVSSGDTSEGFLCQIPAEIAATAATVASTTPREMAARQD